MLNDPRFHAIVRVLFWGGIVLTLVILGMVVFSRFQSVSENLETEEGVVALEEENGRLLVPEKDLPTSLQERLRAPSVTLIPSRYEGVPKAPISSKERKEIISATRSFIRRWDSFVPGDNQYAFRLRSLVREKALSSVASRDDTISLPDVCPEEGCLFGMRSASSPDLLVGEYDGRRAYVVGYGLVEILAAGESNLYNQSYGILLYRSPSGWVVERAAGETLEPAESS